MGKVKNEDRKLEIELTTLQIKHEEDTSTYTIFLSVIVSLIVTALTVYVPLGITLNNPLYFTFVEIFDGVMLAPFIVIVVLLGLSRVSLKNEIADLKRRYLAQDEQKDEAERPQSSSQRLGRRKWFNKTENVALIVSLIALILTGLVTVHELYPPAPRAKLTVFLDTPAIWQGNVTEVEVTGRIVNEGSLTAQILRWDLSFDVNVSYNILFYKTQMLTATVLKPEEECNFTLAKTLNGENDTRLPNLAIRSIGAWFDYEYQLDNSTVIQTAENLVSYLP